jgi:hypothetical protein
MMGTPGSGTEAWQYPSDRYYYGWYNQPPQSKPTDGEIKSEVVDRLRVNPHTKDHDLQVDVKQSVVILTGKVSLPGSQLHWQPILAATRFHFSPTAPHPLRRPRACVVAPNR